MPRRRYYPQALSGGIVRLSLEVLDRSLTDARDFVSTEAPLCFCRSDARFANVIARPDGRLGLVDWEDSGLRDRAVEVVAC